MAKKISGKKPRGKKENNPGAKVAIVIISSILFITIIIVVSVIFAMSKDITLHNLKTSYDSMTLYISYDNDCMHDAQYKIDTKVHDTFGIIDNATEDKYNCRRYFLGSKSETYEKNYAADWQKYDFNKDYPDVRVERVLKNLKDSEGELLSKNDDLFVFGVSDVKNAKDVYADVNSLSALGNDWGSSNFKSISAKVYVRRNGHIEKILFYPVPKSKETSWGSYAINTRMMVLHTNSGVMEKTTADFDSIRNCNEIAWIFTAINETTVDYKETLWNVK